MSINNNNKCHANLLGKKFDLLFPQTNFHVTDKQKNKLIICQSINDEFISKYASKLKATTTYWVFFFINCQKLINTDQKVET